MPHVTHSSQDGYSGERGTLSGILLGFSNSSYFIFVNLPESGRGGVSHSEIYLN